MSATVLTALGLASTGAALRVLAGRRLTSRATGAGETAQAVSRLG